MTMNNNLLQSQSCLVIGTNDYQLCREGWHDRAIDGRTGILYRPTSREAFFDLFLPGGNLDLITLVSASVTLCSGILRGNLFSNGDLIEEFKIDSENWALRRFTLIDAPKGWTHFSWRIHNSFIPHEILKNGDFREMGLFVAAVRIERIQS